MKIVLVTGGFDPLHSGHIAYFDAAKELGDQLVVGVNSDHWLTRKKGKPFMPLEERMNIIANLKMVDYVIGFDDDDNTAIDAIKTVKKLFQSDKVIFANGGDRTNTTTPEYEMYNDDSTIEFAFGVGGEDKRNSSSWILEEWKSPKTYRQWGYYRVLHDVAGMKVKELTVDPGKSLSMQRHFKRNEYWIVSEGKGILNSKLSSGYALPALKIEKHSGHTIPLGEWHQLTNPFDEPCKIVEIQYGMSCDESDIERE